MNKYFTNIHKNKTYNYIIRFTIVAATYYFIYKQIFEHRKLDYVVNSFKDLIHEPHVSFLITWTVLLMIVNWGIESLKWQFLINKVEKVSFLKSFEAILSGISVSIFTPNRVGEWFGRVFIMKKANPWKGVFITMIGSFSQLLITIIVGSISLVFYIPIYFQDSGFYSIYLLYGVILLVVVIITALILIYLNISIIPGFVSRIIKQRFSHFNDYLSVISSYSTFELLTVLLLSLLRYCVFAIQFYILLMMFSVEIPITHGLMVISLVFFIMTAIPTVTLAELGVRGSVSLYFIGLYFERFGEISDKINIGIVSSTSTLWLINLAFPALLGTLFVYRLTFFRKKKT
ncbi:MAG: lysylphosphatidylglycerol synthase domain-containing protein [Bacteroidales bacterium]|nr:lysylphosphatidylglycerol synthase domain-containing protein [Bacteroidales bacterium]